MNITQELLKSFLFQAFSVLARLFLSTCGGMLIERGLVSGNQWSAFLVGLATVLTMLVWSLVEKYNLLRFLGIAMSTNSTITLEEIKKTAK